MIQRQGTDALSEREKAVLRLLSQGYDVKGVALALDLSVYAVNERLRVSRRKLGVGSSREAARKLAESEGTAHRNSVDENSGIVPVPSPTPQAALLDPQATDSDEAPPSLVGEQEQGSKAGLFPDLKGGGLALPLRRTGDNRNPLSKRQRLAAILEITTKLAAVLALTCLVAILISSIARSSNQGVPVGITRASPRS